MCLRWPGLVLGKQVVLFSVWFLDVFALSPQASSVPLPEAPADSDLEVSDEDVHFVDEYSQRLGFLTALNRAQIDRHARLHACNRC